MLKYRAGSWEEVRQSLKEQRGICREHFASQNDKKMKKQNKVIKQVGRQE